MNSTELKSSWALGGVFASRMLGLFMIMPVFSLYAQHLPNTTPTLIGLALGIYGLTQAIFQLPFGFWSDYIPRHRVIYLGLCLFTLGSLIAAFSHSIYGIIIGRALQGSGAIGSTVIALLADLISAENRPKAMAIVGATIGLAFCAAMVLGPILNNLINIPGIFLLTAGLAITAMILLKRYVPVPIKQHAEFSWSAVPQQFQTILFQGHLLRINAAIFVTHATLTAMFVVLPTLLVNQYHLPANQHWHLYLPVFLLAALSVGTTLRKKHTLNQQIKISLASMGWIFINQLSLSNHLASHLWSIGLGLWLFFYGFTMLEATLPSLVSQFANEKNRGAATGLFSTCQFLGIFIGGVLGGYVTSRYDVQSVFYVTSILIAICFILFWPLRKVTSTSGV